MRISRLWILVLAGCGAAAAESGPAPAPFVPASGDRYTIDASAGRFTAKVGVGGVLSAFGHEHTMALRDFSGEARLAAGGGPEGGTVRLSLRADSVAEIGEKFDAEERKKIDQDVRSKVLEAEKFPKIDFQGTAVSATPLGENKFQARIDGQLTLHGITKPLTIPAEVTVRGDTLTARGQFTIKHSDYGLQRLGAAGGMVKASDPIVFTFDLVGRAAPRAP